MKISSLVGGGGKVRWALNWKRTGGWEIILRKNSAENDLVSLGPLVWLPSVVILIHEAQWKGFCDADEMKKVGILTYWNKAIAPFSLPLPFCGFLPSSLPTPSLLLSFFFPFFLFLLPPLSLLWRKERAVFSWLPPGLTHKSICVL